MVEAARDFLTSNGFGEPVDMVPISGGVTSLVLRLTFADGRTSIYKESVNAKPGMYRCEVDGLRALRREGCPRTPEVFSVDEDHVLIEDLGPQEPPEGFWASFGRALGHLHSITAPRYGYDKPNYLGTMPMDNDWMDDGWSFFIETRLLNFLEMPKAEAVLSRRDRQEVEALAKKIRERIPYQPPSLIHGDLWTGNMLVAHGKEPALIDPSIHYGWPEADLAMLPMADAITPDFWDAYLEVHPLEPGWRERFDLLTIRDPLCMIAEYGDLHDSYKRFREWMAKVP